MARTTNQDSVFIDATGIDAAVEASGLPAKDIARASGMSLDTLKRNRYGFDRGTSIGNAAQLANVLGYDLRLEFAPRTNHETGTKSVPLRIPLGVSNPVASLHPLIAGPVNVFGAHSRVVALPSIAHAAVSDLLEPHEIPKLAAMSDPMLVLRHRARYQFRSKPAAMFDILTAHYAAYLAADPRATDFTSTLLTTGNRPLVVLAPKPNHTHWHHVAWCAICKTGGNLAGKVLEQLRTDLERGV